MKYIELDNKEPNQKFTFSDNGLLLEVTFKTIDNITFMSVSLNGNNIVNSVKVTGNTPIIKYDYLQKKYGDFVFTTTDSEYPVFSNFNSSNKFYHLSYEEVKNYNG